MSNPRSASNAWAKIKAKLSANVPEGGSPASTPKKAGRKKAASATPAGNEGEEGGAPQTPKLKATPRKRAAKKQDVEGDESSKKKGRAAKKSEESKCLSCG
jgi:hypothetical protein